jgi:dipeptidyl aminopeptidase/acylaminoacyl peptidase
MLPEPSILPALRQLAWVPLLLLALLACAMAAPARAGVGPSVKEVIEFTRIIQPVGHDDETLRTQVSPDGTRAFIVTRRADVATDINWFEVLLLDVEPSRLAASRPAAPVRLLTVEARRDENDAYPALQDVRWHGDDILVFRARMNDEPYQAYRLDLPTRQVTQLTFAAFGVAAFDLTVDLRRVVYVAPLPNPAMPPGARSVVVGTNSFWSVHFGQDDLRKQQRRYQYFVGESGSRTGARALGEPFAESSLGLPSTSISPDGRWLLLPRYEPHRQLAWAKQYPYVADMMAKYGPSLRIDPLSYFSRPSSYVTRRLVAYDLADGRERVVVDAPDDSMQDNQRRADRLWQDGGRSVVIAGTFLPVREGDAGNGSASHIIEFWPESGRWKDIAVLEKRLKSAHPIAGKSGAFVVKDGDRRRVFVRGADRAWLEVVEGGPQEAGQVASTGAWRLHVQQALNQPPDIVAAGPAGAVVRLTDLNPQYSAERWGSMREYGWKDAKGRAWKGGLMVPADFNPRVRHPLVIQAYGFSPTRFYRDGSNVYDGFTSGFAGRAFLREGILVLALPLGPSADRPADERGRRIAFADGVRAAIEALVADGLVDREKVGIMGWSATGESVLNLVTFTDVPIRAATLLDGDANTLFSVAITYSVVDGTLLHKERANQGGPYGESRMRWVANDPSLHTDCIRAAMRIETYGNEVHNNWDVYALLRRQYKPAEMIMIPDGAHALSRPSERMISLQGNVDWYRFWLKGEKRTEVVVPTETAASLKQQYERWDQMAALKQADDARPACVRTADFR